MYRICQSEITQYLVLRNPGIKAALKEHLIVMHHVILMKSLEGVLMEVAPFMAVTNKAVLKTPFTEIVLCRFLGKIPCTFISWNTSQDDTSHFEDSQSLLCFNPQQS